MVSTHSRPKAAGICDALVSNILRVSTHSRPKAAGSSQGNALGSSTTVSTHSRPKAAGMNAFPQLVRNLFQHTAARRRLDIYIL